MRMSSLLLLVAPFVARAAATAEHAASASLDRFGTYLITLKEGVPESRVADVIKAVEAAGGIVLERYTLIPCIKAELPIPYVAKLQAAFAFADVEEDGEMHILKRNDHIHT
ncbi:hypothetical protein BC831DRAFT_515112 [Entophlyctis helioformis]|nr:hypothetical protein BC831DRAFT_515112 [Entophlyctis helioformis]